MCYVYYYLHIYVIIINPQINKNGFFIGKDIIINGYTCITFCIISLLFSIKQRKCIIINFIFSHFSIPSTKYM